MDDLTAPLCDEDAAAADPLKRGQMFGRYLLIDRVGAGGVGAVHAAYDPDLDRRVALKLLHSETGHHSRTGDESQPSAVAAQRLLREAKALAKLSHPNVVTVHEVGHEQGRTFIAMELVEGCDLSTWLDGDGAKLGWRERLPILLDAGRGLQAAHDKNTIHRDFKPANVLIGNDRRVRVSDFGLARLLDPGPGDEVSQEAMLGEPDNPLSTLVTRGGKGQLVGTPYYMAPEQYEGRATILSDIYAFCMTAHEVLYGRRPFPVGTLPALVARKLDGAPAAPPEAPNVSSRIRRALQRGMAPVPEMRWPSMAALLDELERGASPSRRGWWAGVGSVALASTGVALVLAGDDEICEGAELHLDGVWDDTQRATLESTYRESGISFAGETFDRLGPALDAYAENWTAAHRETCEATQRGEQSPELLDRKMICLRERLTELNALVDVLGRTDEKIIERSLSAVARLPPARRCVDVTSADQLAPLPEDPAAVEAQRTELAVVDALRGAGQYTEAASRAGPIVERARTIGDKRLLADALHRHGDLEQKLGRIETAEEALEDAVWTAQADAYGDGQIQSSSLLSYVVGVRASRPQDGLRWVRYAKAQLERDDAPATAHSTVLNNEGSIYERTAQYARARETYEQAIAVLEEAGVNDDDRMAGLVDNIGTALRYEGRFEEAIDYGRRALAIREALLGADHPLLARSLNNVATSLGEMARFEEADRLHERALAIREKAFGRDHLDVAITLNNLAASYYRQGRLDEAQAAFERILEIRKKALPPGHPKVASSLGNLGLMMEGQGELEKAGEYYQQALQIYESLPDPDIHGLGTNLGNLGNLRTAQERYDEAAAQYERALALYEEHLGPEHPEVAMMLSNLGNVVEAQGRFEEARAHHHRALTIRERVLGPEHPDLMFTLGGLAGSYQAAGDPATAIPLLERALAIGQKATAAPENLGAIEFELAQALWATNIDRERALELARSARGRYAALLPRRQDTLHQVDEWLADEAGR